tara:strand:+ start:160 stop:492 length:333 start_codon:yes stop_codon:yes gene_type:complete
MKITIDITMEGEPAISALRAILAAPAEPTYVKVAKTVLNEQKKAKTAEPKKGKHPFNGIDVAVLQGVWNNAKSVEEVCDYYGADYQHKSVIQSKAAWLRRKKGMKFKHFD